LERKKLILRGGRRWARRTGRRIERHCKRDPAIRCTVGRLIEGLLSIYNLDVLEDNEIFLLFDYAWVVPINENNFIILSLFVGIVAVILMSHYPKGLDGTLQDA
jgi:hypothetical protein